MNAITYTDLRQNLKSFMDKVYFDHEALIITRKNSQNVVMISLDEFNSLTETSYLLSNDANSEHLMKSIEQYKSGKLMQKELVTQ